MSMTLKRTREEIKQVADSYGKTLIDIASDTGLAMTTVLKYFKGKRVNASTDFIMDAWAILQERPNERS